jgi:hypothetical protein
VKKHREHSNLFAHTKNLEGRVNTSRDLRLGVVYVESIRTSRGAPISLRNFNVKAMSQTSATFLKIWTGSSSFGWEAQIGHPSPEEIFVNPQFPMGIRRN